MESLDYLYLRQRDIDNIISHKCSDDVIIFLSGKSSCNTPLKILQSNDTIAVNGSAIYLIDNNISPFIYLVTDKKFYLAKPDDFWRSVEKSRFSIVSLDVYKHANKDGQHKLREKCLILKDVYTRQFGGPVEVIKYLFNTDKYSDVKIYIPLYWRHRKVGFSLNIVKGYCPCHTVAYGAMQISYTLKYKRIICSGLDMNESTGRFYENTLTQSNVLPCRLDYDFQKVMSYFIFMKNNIDIKVYNLSTNTRVPYNVIPLISPSELG
ncbi:TPA: 3-deoxy-D-manno-oct-2-ulosonate III transferase WaaZ [Citrobacter freundii]